MTTQSTELRFVDIVLAIDGGYFDHFELYLAATADGFEPLTAWDIVDAYQAEADEEFAQEAAAEMWAEGAWLRAAEAGDWESERDLLEHLACFPDGYRTAA